MQSKYLKYKNKYLNLRKKIKYLVGGNILLRVENSRRIIERLERIELTKCINSFKIEDKIGSELIEIERILGSGVNGEALSIILKGPEPITVAVKTIPISKNDYDNFTRYRDGIDVISPLAEIKALEICTQYVFNQKSPHFNITYKHLLCNNCKYVDEKVQNLSFNDGFPETYKEKLNEIKKANAIKEGNSIKRGYKIKDIQQFNNIDEHIIDQYCIYIFNEKADGDMSNLINDTLSFNNLKIYLFQIFSALNLCYIEDEMSHHDLHSKNILYVNDEYNDVDHDLYNIVIETDDKSNRETIPVKLPLNGKMLRIWDFGKVNVQNRIHIIKSSYFRENKRERFSKDVEKFLGNGEGGLLDNQYINSNREFREFIEAIRQKYIENGYYNLMKYLIEKINEINVTCVTERNKYNFL